MRYEVLINIFCIFKNMQTISEIDEVLGDRIETIYNLIYDMG